MIFLLFIIFFNIFTFSFIENNILSFGKKLTCKNNEFKQFYLQNKFNPVVEEKTINIKHNSKLFSKLTNNIFSQIGSNPKHIDSNSDYHWFDGDGMIHSVLFNNTDITYQNKWIRTKRLEIENKWKQKIFIYFGELKGFRGIFQIIKFSIMQLFGFISQSKGTANTAILNWKNRIFALHEGDMPYELNIDYNNFNITTLKRLHYPSIYSTTAHPIVDARRDKLYLYGYNNYDFSNGKFIFNSFDKNMQLFSQKNISLINNGMTHDVGFTGNELIIPDMPLKYDFSLILKEKLPMYFDKDDGITRFGIFSVDTLKEPKWYYFDENFFIFHFSKCYRKYNDYIIFACVMDNLFMEDFVDLKNIENENHIIRGDIRLKKIIIDTHKNTTSIIENNYLQNLNLGFFYNLDFPISSKLHPNYVYCTIFDSALGYIKGYIGINTDDFENAKPNIFLFENNTFGNSEPQVTIVNNTEYLVSFINDNSNSYISLIDIHNNYIEKIEIPTRIPPGFHSIFYDI